MEEPFYKKHIKILIIFALIILTSLVIALNLLQRRSQEEAATGSQLPTQPVAAVPKRLEAAPTFSPNQGQGVDTESQQAKESTSEIAKLYPDLPYLKDIKLSTGVNVSIVIPAKELQEGSWTLLVQIFGVDYDVPQDGADSQLMKNSFREAANTVFEWMKGNGADPEKIIISWGDREFIQVRAEEWLD